MEAFTELERRVKSSERDSKEALPDLSNVGVVIMGLEKVDFVITC